MSMLHYYAYYRADPSRLEELRRVVADLFRVLEASSGVRGLLRRSRGEPATYMEFYENVADGAAFERVLAEALGRLRFERFSPRRKTEIFQDVEA